MIDGKFPDPYDDDDDCEDEEDQMTADPDFGLAFPCSACYNSKER